MKKYRLLFGLLVILLAILVWVMLDVESTERLASPQVAKNPASVTPVVRNYPNERDRTSVAVRRIAPVIKAEVDAQPTPSESELLGEDGVSAPQPDYPPKPEVPDYEMPEGPEIMSFDYQRLHFKNMPDDKRMGVALYVKVDDAARRKYAYLHRTYLSQLTNFLASKYEYEAVKTEAGKQRFLTMLKLRFARRLKGNKLAELDAAFFEEVDL